MLGLTIAVIVLICIYFAFPIIIYTVLMSSWFFGKSLEKELKDDGLIKRTKTNENGAPQDQVLEVNGESSVRTKSKIPLILLSFKNVYYTIPTKQGPVKILKGIDGWFKHGTLTAVMGPSGCGKSTLLDVLADMKDFGAISGDVRVNGKPKTQMFRKVAAYVMQNDVLYPNLTVRETLWFVTELRLPHLLSSKEKHNVVQEVITSLGLDFVADSRIGSGDSGGGLSGGQKRRVTVAIELITKPSLVFLDEPTSGLDAYGSLQVVSVLRKLADEGRTIVCTIHQPRSDIFKLFDNLLLMKLGRVMYFGHINGVLPFFEKCGVKADAKVNPADFIVDLTHDKTPEEVEAEKNQLIEVHRNRMKESSDPKAQKESESILKLIETNTDVDVFVAIYSQSKIFRENIVQLLKMHLGNYPDMPPLLESNQDPSDRNNNGKYTTSFWKQNFTLTRRAFLNDMRNPSYIMTWVLGAIMSLFYGMLYSSVISPTLNGSDYSNIGKELSTAGICTQNMTTLSQITGMSSESLNNSVELCAEALDENFLLSIARSGFLYQLLAANFFSEFPMVASVYLDKAMFFREHSSRSYSSGAWCFSWYTRMFFAGFLKGLIFPPMVYFSGHLAPYAEPYFLFCIFMSAMSLAGSSVALLCSSAIYSLETASVAFVVINIFAQNLSGYFMYSAYIPWWFKWIYYIYTYEGTVFSQRLVPSEEGSQEFSNVQARAWVFALVALIFCLGFQLLAFIFTWVYYRAVSVQVVAEEGQGENEKDELDRVERELLEEEEKHDEVGIIAMQKLPSRGNLHSSQRLTKQMSKVGMLAQLKMNHDSNMRGFTAPTTDTGNNDIKNLGYLAMPGNAPVYNAPAQDDAFKDS